jgi:hypothetical protein
VTNSKRKRRGPLPAFIGPIEVTPADHGYVVRTDPGCVPGDPFYDMHQLEVFGAGMALDFNGPWEGGTLMDCGCVLDVLRWEDLPQ